MKHLDDEQLDALLTGPSTSSHIDQCDICRQKLAERQAVRNRLASAFSSVQPPKDLAGRITAQLRIESTGEAPSRKGHSRGAHPLLRRLWPALAAAAALLAAAIPLVVYFASGEPAVAELIRIHEKNLSHEHELFASENPAEMADYFRKELGFAAEVPQLGQGMSMRGCCVSRFRGSPVGSYVVETPRGFVSVIVLTNPPEKLDSGGTLDRGDRTYWLGAFAHNRTAAVRIGDYTYCAVGQAEQTWLVDLLEQLLPS